MEKNSDIISKMIKQAGYQQPSADFTSNVMDKIKPLGKHSYADRPVVPKMFWVFTILIVLITFLSIWLIPDSRSSEPSVALDISRTIIDFFQMFSINIDIIPLIAFIFIGLWGLYFLDRIVSRHID